MKKEHRGRDGTCPADSSSISDKGILAQFYCDERVTELTVKNTRTKRAKANLLSLDVRRDFTSLALGEFQLSTDLSRLSLSG